MTHEATNPISADLHQQDASVGTHSRMPQRLRRWWADMMHGFHEHGWSGKLYLLTGSVTWITTLTVIPFMILWLAEGGASPGRDFGAGTHIFVSTLVLTSLYVGYRVLTGVARFHRRARNFAILFSAAGTLATLSQVRQGGAVAATVVLQAALSVQFIVYFIRNGDRFLSARQRALLDQARAPDSGDVAGNG